MVEHMAGEGTSTPESGAVATAPAEVKAPASAPEKGAEATEPNVVISPEKNVHQPGGILDRWFGTRPQVLVRPEEAQDNTAEQQPQAAPTAPPPPGGTDGGGGDGRGPEEPRGPEESWSEESIWTPEFRRDGIRIKWDIINIEALSYRIKYNDHYGPILDRRYQQFRIWKNLDRKRAFIRPPFKPKPEAPPQPVSAQVEEKKTYEKQDLNGLPSLKEVKNENGEIVEKGLLNTYNSLRDGADPDNPNATPDQIDQRIKEAEEQLAKYFQEAKRLNLLGGVDVSLRLLYVDIMRGVYPREKNRKLSPTEIWKNIRENQAEISDLGEKAFKALRRQNRQLAPEMEKLDGVWDVYAQLTIDRFARLLNGGGLTEEFTMDGEFTFGGESLEELNQFATSDEQLRKLYPTDEDFTRQVNQLFPDADQEYLREAELAELINRRERQLRRAMRDREEAVARYSEDRARYRQMAEESELFWQPTYANYFEVYARTPEQFQIAIETFTQWIRSGLTKSPSEIFQRARGFQDALTTAGLRERMDNDFMIGLRRELEATVAVLGANHANENYKNDYYKQFMDFGVADEGPERFVRLARAHRGKTGPVLWKLDHDPRIEILHNPFGSRGQLFNPRNPIEWEELQAEALNLLVIETMGLEIKGYHPDDPKKVLDPAILEQNLNEIANFMSDERFKDLYEGFDFKEQENLYQQLTDKQRRANRAGEIQEQLVAGMLPSDLQGEDLEIYEELNSGRQFSDLLPAEKLTLRRLQRVSHIQQRLLNGMDPSELKGEDLRFYQEAKNTVALAFELYGVMAEKARRGGGVFQVDRNVHIEAYQKLKDIADASLTPEQRRSKRIARILLEVRKGRKIDESKLNALSQEDRQFFATLKREDLGDFVDYLANFWAEKVVHSGENWVKATYGGELDPEIQTRLQQEKHSPNPVRGIPADELQFRVDQARRMTIWAVKTFGYDAKLWDFTLLRNGKPADPNFGYVKDLLGEPYGINRIADNDVQKYKYAVPENPRVLGYHSQGEGVILVFDDNGKPIEGKLTGLEFDGKGQPIIYDQPTEFREIESWVNGEIIRTQRKREPVKFDNLNRNAQARPMELKIPRGTIDPKTGKMIVAGEAEKVPLDFDTIKSRFHSHPYSRWTAHPYWGYQEEDTGLILTEDAFKDAEKIKRGQLLPEDAEPHATQLLVVDPTLQRVTHFADRESREDKIVLDAVEESNQGHWLITDELHMAFYPEDADDEYNRIVYAEQDWGGLTKMWLNPRALYARWTDMLGRRGRTMGPVVPLRFSSKPGMDGADGVLGELRMMNYGERGARGSYRMVGQFSLEKWINQTESAQDLFEALTGYASPQEKKDREGYLEKPTDDADVTLMAWYPDTPYLLRADSNQENKDIRFMVDVRKSRGRQETVIQRIRVHDTTRRGERGPRFSKGVDIFERNPDGSIKILGGEKVFNSKIDSDRDVGTSRHTGSIFFWRDTAWLRSAKPWEGQETYPREAIYYQYMDLPQDAEKRLARQAKVRGKTYIPQSRFIQQLGKVVR